MFVGRLRELTAIEQALSEGRLVTLVGEAGVGKTRLAQRVALSQRSVYEGSGGVWFCELCDARDVEAMSAVVARALSIADEATAAGEASVTAIGRALAARGRALVVLDNVEQLLPRGADVILRWLDLAPEARFLVTSREPLYLIGEDPIEVGPLTLPEGAALEGDAAALFVERVRARRSGFVPSVEESSAIADLVRRVRGVPLAIELCASRFAEGDPRALPAPRPGRCVSSDAQAIAWGYLQLGPEEREVLAQCSVFRGGFTVAAAEHVVALSRAAEARPVGEVIEALVQKGLVRATRGEGAAPRLSLCEAIRAHAAGTLSLGDEASGAPFRHARYYLDLASGPLTDLPATPASVSTREELAAERENLEAVLDLGAQGRRPDLVLRAAIALDVIASGTGLSRAQLVLLDDALRTGDTGPRSGIDAAMIGRALGVRAGALRAQGKLEEAERDAQVALALARHAGSARQIVAMHLAVGVARFQLGDLEPALTHARAALVEATAAGDGTSEPLALQQVGGVLQAMGDASGARAHYEAALALGVERADEVAECRAAMGLGSYHLEAGDLERAEAYYERGLLIARRLKMQRNLRIVTGYLGVLHLDAGRAQEAELWLDNAARLSRNVGDVRVEGIFTGMRGAALAMLDLVDEARDAFAMSLDLLRQNPYFAAVIELHQGHLSLAEARVLRAEGEDALADALIEAAEQRLAAAEAGEGDRPPLTRRSDDARIAARILRRALSVS
ncbi:Signal transduction response regulator [Minicystis rosea]|nr:Signal transduction response regulator [Minicystis rosea]